MSERLVALGLGALVVAALLAACATATTSPPAAPATVAAFPAQPAPPSAPGAARPLERVTAATIGAGSTGDAGFALAAGLGYLAEEGLELDGQRLANASILVPAMQRGDIPVAGMSVNAALLSGLAQGGLQARIVADKGSNHQGGGGFVVLVRRDLVESGRVRELRDLRGLRVASNQRGGVFSYYMDTRLQADGLSMADLQTLILPFGEQLTALESGAIDAGLNVEPNGTAAVERGIASIFRTGMDIVPEAQGGVVVATTAWLAENRPRAVAFLRAYLRGARTYDTWLRQGQPADGVAALLAEWAQQAGSAELLTRTLPYGLRPDGALNVADMQSAADWFHANGMLDTPLQVAAYVDDTPRQEALASLPAYPPAP